MIDICPLCGRPTLRSQASLIETADALVAALLRPIPSQIKLTKRQIRMGETLYRSVYLARDLTYHITYGGFPQVTWAAIDEALNAGLICDEFDVQPRVECWKLK
jgi:hypothetical protein